MYQEPIADLPLYCPRLNLKESQNKKAFYPSMPAESTLSVYSPKRKRREKKTMSDFNKMDPLSI